jgi:hypothetical protein
MEKAVRLPNPFDTPPDQRWHGPDNTANLRNLKAQQAAAKAATPPIVEDFRDPLTIANEKIAALEAQVSELQIELEKVPKIPAHQQGRETR